MRPPSLLCPSLLQPHNPPTPAGTPRYLHSITLSHHPSRTLPPCAAPSSSSSCPCLLAKPTQCSGMGKRPWPAGTLPPPAPLGCSGPGHRGRFRVASWTREWAAGWDAGRDALCTIAFSNWHAEIETGWTSLTDVGEPETQVARLAWPPKCQLCCAAGPGSAQYRSPHPVSPVPSPRSARPQAGGPGVVGEVRVGRREVPPRASPPHPAAPTRSPGSLAASDSTYGATATSAAAAARPLYATSLCSCLDSLITWRQRERDCHPSSGPPPLLSLPGL